MLDPKGFGRIRMQRIPDVSKASLIGFVKASVEPGATVCTDGWRSYLTLPDHGYTHQRIVMTDGDDAAHVAMPGAHRVASLLKRWLLGSHQGAVEPQHLDAYLNEFTFRFNPDPPIGWLGGVKSVRRGVVVVREAAWSCV